MKILLIKFGKALNTIKRDGLIRGGKRVFTAFFAMLKMPKKGDVLFVTGGVGDSALYRTAHVAEELEINGIKCGVTIQDNPFLAKYASEYKVFIFHRVLFTPSVSKMIEEIKKQGREIIFETDDLVYDPKYLKYMDYFQKMNQFEKKLYENGVGGEILNDEYVKLCTTTTIFLADKLKEKGKDVFIVKNKLSQKDVQNANEALDKQAKKTGEIINLGYFSGTISHNKDFATITEALIQVMEKHKSVRLFLVGPLDLENELVSKFKDRIVQLPYVPRKKHFANIAKVDINLAPLEIDNPFCEAKSELKFFEAGIVGVPTVAVANRTYSEAIEDGVDGFTAATTEEWVKKIQMLIIDSKLRSDMGKKAREKTLKEYTTENGKNEEYYTYLRSKINSL